MKHPSLVILAAGMGSRYGGLKQIDTLGNNGESIIDFSIYDAIKAGFKKVYLIIRKEHTEAFENSLGKKIRPFIEVEYVYQELSDLPVGFSVPEGREKPWGTTHAMWACRKQVKEPFMICNADDYYGIDAFKTMYDFLVNEVTDTNYSLIGYRLVNTLSDSGSVTRGVCDVKDGKLIEVVERQEIKKHGHKVITSDNGRDWNDLDPQGLVSMNFWGFTPAVFDLAEKQFVAFLKSDLEGNPMKCEHVIPTMIGETLDKDLYTMNALTSENTWYGVTYKEDKPQVVEEFKRMKAENLYPFDLWAK